MSHFPEPVAYGTLGYLLGCVALLLVLKFSQVSLAFRFGYALETGSQIMAIL